MKLGYSIPWLAPSLITTIAYRDDATFPRRWNPATGLWDPDKRRDVTISCEREKRSGGERSSAANRKLATSRGNYRSEIWIIFQSFPLLCELPSKIAPSMTIRIDDSNPGLIVTRIFSVFGRRQHWLYLRNYFHCATSFISASSNESCAKGAAIFLSYARCIIGCWNRCPMFLAPRELPIWVVR